MTSEGYMKAWVTVARTGELEYFNTDAGGARKEIVTRNSLLGKKAIRTIKGLPVTHGHPIKNGKKIELDSINAKEFQRGSTLESIDYDPPFFSVVTSITDKRLIDAIKSGNNGASLGYAPEKQRINSDTLEQLDREYNHLALGFPPEFARGGTELGVQFDSTDIFSGELGTPEQKTSIETNLDQNNMTTGTLNFDSGASYQIDSNALKLIDAERQQSKTQIDSLTQANSLLKTENEEKQQELDQTKGELEATKQKLEEAQNVDHSGEITTRMEVWGEVLPALQQIDSKAVADYKLSVNDVKKLYLEKVKGLNVDSYNDDTIYGLYLGHRPNPQQDSKDYVNSQYDSLGSRNYDGMRNKRRRGDVESIANKRKERPLLGYRGGKM